MKLLKKAMALILALTMCVGLLSLNVFAAQQEIDQNYCPVSGGSHQFDYRTKEEPTTCTDGWSGGYYCELCGWDKDGALLPAPHDPAEAVRENETVDSYDEVVYCSECKKELSRETIKAEECKHTNAIPATCTSPMFCLDCQESVGEVNPDNHTGAANWTADGDKHVETCNACNGAKQSHAAADCTEDCPLYKNTSTGECEHDWVKDENRSIEPTETEGGLYVYKCSKCGKDNFVSQDPTGTKQCDHAKMTNCLTWGTCPDCGSWTNNPNKHTGNDHWAFDPNNGDHVKYCGYNNGKGGCGAELERHAEKNCTACPLKGQTNHIWSEDKKLGTGEYKAATCTEEGFETWYHACKVDGCNKVETWKVTLEVTDHNPGEPVRENENPATATVDGSHDEVVYCTACKAEISRKNVTDPATGTQEHEHVLPDDYPYGWSTYKAPTCTEPGYYSYTCRDMACHKDFNVEIPKLGHSFEKADELIAEVPATCEKEGTKAHYHCDTCDKYFGTGTTGEVQPEDLVIAKLPHTPAEEAVRENEVPATTTVDGSHDEVIYCTVCGDEISRNNVIDPATGTDPAPAPGTGDMDPFTPGDDDNSDVEIDDVAVPLASGPITRAEFVDYLWRHENEPSGSAPTFADVSADHEFVLAIGWGQMIGIIYGRGNNEFAPDDLVTVSDVRLILDRFAIWKGLDVDVYALATLTGEDDDIVMNCGEVVAEFFGEEYAAGEDAA